MEKNSKKQRLEKIKECISREKTVYLDILDQELLIKNSSISFIKNHLDIFDLSSVFSLKRLKKQDLEFFLQNAERKDFVRAIIYQDLSEDIMERYEDKMVWSLVSVYQKNLSLKFIEKYKLKLDYGLLPYFQRNLTADFLKKYNLDKRVNWKTLSANYILTERFLTEYFEFLDKNLIEKNPKAELTDDIKLLLALN